jgi:hypothetical protein
MQKIQKLSWISYQMKSKYAGRNVFVYRKSTFTSPLDMLHHKIHGWDVQTHITYEFNDYGFRGVFDPELDMCIGDSRTFGWGIETENTYPYLLQCNNFGVSGSGWQTFLRLVKEWLEDYHPKNIYLLDTWLGRREIELNGEYFQVSAMGQRGEDSIIHKLPEFDENENESIKSNSLLQIQSLCADKGINLVYIDMQDFPPTDGKAHDGIHPGIKWHRDIAKEFKKRC